MQTAIVAGSRDTQLAILGVERRFYNDEFRDNVEQMYRRVKCFGFPEGSVRPGDRGSFFKIVDIRLVVEIQGDD